MALTEEEKKQLRHLSNPDYGVPGSGYDSLRDGITLAPTPGTNSTVDLLNATRQVLFESTRVKRLDDGFRGDRMAKVLHIEKRDAKAIPDKKFVSELLSEIPVADGQRDAAMNTIIVIYAIPAGGICATNELPDNISFSSDSPTSSEIDISKIYNYPRFYAFQSVIGEESEINPGDFINVEIRDYVEYSYGVFKSFHASSDMFHSNPTAGDPAVGPADAGVNPNSANFNKDSVNFPVPADFRASLNTSGGFVGTTTYGGADTLKTTPMTEEHKKNRNLRNRKNKKGVVIQRGHYGAISQPIRKDINQHFLKAQKDFTELGVGWYSVGALQKALTQAQRKARAKRGGASLSLHYLGRAFDFHTGMGMMFDQTTVNLLRKNGFDADITPGYEYYISPNGPRRYILYGLSKDPTVPKTTILACFAGWSKGSPLFCEEVHGRFVNLTQILANNGFSPIRQHSGCTPMDDTEKECMGPNGSAARAKGGRQITLDGPSTARWQKNGGGVYQHFEWWHFQFTGDLVKGKTSWGSQLVAVYSEKEINASFGPPDNVRYWGGKVKHWADPTATYGTHWG